jgi:hypothetical protein
MTRRRLVASQVRAAAELARVVWYLREKAKKAGYVFAWLLELMARHVERGEHWRDA